jgi:hypothetical protein
LQGRQAHQHFGDPERERQPPVVVDTGAMPAPQPLAMQDASQAKICRICLDGGAPFISPCRCRGSAKYVHRTCLDEWRAQQSVPLAFTHCSVCRFEYEVVDARPEPSRIAHFRLAVARDSLLLFGTVQTTIALLAIVLHAVDQHWFCPQQPDWSIPCNTSLVPGLFPSDWADRTSVVHLSIGPYYVSSVLLLLALLGVVGLALWLTDRLPKHEPVPPPSTQWQRMSSHAAPAAIGALASTTSTLPITPADDTGSGSASSPDAAKAEARAMAATAAEVPGPRARRASRDGCCDRCCDRCCDGCCDGCCRQCNCTVGYIDCCSDCNCDCPSNCNCDNCKCDGEGALVLVVVAFVIFVVIGIFVGIFFATIAIQRIVQRHMHLLNMRTAAERFPVVDLGEDEEGGEAVQPEAMRMAR